MSSRIIPCLFVPLILIIACGSMAAQCINTALFPTSVFNASNYSNDTTLITASQYAGEYALVSGMAPGATYRFIVTTGLFITISDLDDNVLSSGLSSVDYAPVDDTIKVHVNLTLPPCGSNTTAHILSLYCVTCPESTSILMGVPAAVNNSAIVKIDATQQGVLIPRFTTSQKNNIPDPANGLLVFDTDLGTVSAYDGFLGSWSNLRTSSSRTKTVVIPADNFHAISQVDGNPSVDYFTDQTFGRYGNFSTANNAAVFTAGLELPVGSVINQIKYYYYDNNPTLNLTFQIVRSNLSVYNESSLNTFVTSGNTSSKRSSTQNVNISITGGNSFFMRAYGRTLTSATYASMGIVGVEITYTEP